MTLMRNLRSSAVFALGKIGPDAAAVLALITALNDPE
jgi:hypothetical protein